MRVGTPVAICRFAMHADRVVAFEEFEYVIRAKSDMDTFSAGAARSDWTFN